MKIFKYFKKNFFIKDLLTTEEAFYLFGKCIYCCSINKVGGWVRIFGIGLTWKNKSEGLLFSERYGYTKYFEYKNKIIKFLY